MTGQIRVLVVDDDPMCLELAKRNLRAYNFEVTTASSTFGVTNLIRKLSPDIVLLDVDIPALSGDAALGLARRHAPAHTKFVLYSSNDEHVLRRIAKECGADGWISKSVEPPVLAAQLERLMRS